MTSHSSTARSVQKRYAMDTDYLVDFAKRRPSPKATSAVSNRRRRRSEILELLFKDAEAVKGEATSRGETQSSLALSRVVLRSTTRARSCRRSWQKTTRRGHPHSRSLSSIDVDMSDSEEEEEGRTASQTRSVLLKTCFQSEIEAARRPSRRERRKGKGETPDSSKVTTPILQKRSQNPLQSEKSSRKSRSQSLKTEKLVTGMSKKPLQKERSTRKSRSRSLKTEKSGVVEGKSSRKSRKGIVMKSQSLPLLGLYMSDSEEEEDQSAPPSRTDNQKEQHDRKESKGGIPSSSGGRSRRTSASRRPRSGKNDSSNTSMTPSNSPKGVDEFVKEELKQSLLRKTRSERGLALFKKAKSRSRLQKAKSERSLLPGLTKSSVEDNKEKNGASLNEASSERTPDGLSKKEKAHRLISNALSSLERSLVCVEKKENVLLLKASSARDLTAKTPLSSCILSVHRKKLLKARSEHDLMLVDHEDRVASHAA